MATEIGTGAIGDGIPAVDNSHIPKKLKDYLMTNSKVIVGNRENIMHTSLYLKKNFILAKQKKIFWKFIGNFEVKNSVNRSWSFDKSAHRSKLRMLDKVVKKRHIRESDSNSKMLDQILDQSTCEFNTSINKSEFRDVAHYLFCL